MAEKETMDAMDDREWLAARFERHRGHLRAVAYRMLGSPSEADDAVQEAWLRLGRADAADVENLGGWLTTVVARICLDLLRARKARREEPLAAEQAAGLGGRAPGPESDPEREALLADAVGPALLVVLDTLTPAERLAFVLHDLFAVPFAEIAPIVGRTPAAARQLASRARRRVQGAAALPTADRGADRQRPIVAAFLAAAREGDFAALLGLLDPEVVLRADGAAVGLSAAARGQGAPQLEPEVRGAAAVAETFAGRAQAAQPALVDGAAGAVWAPDGTPRSVFAFTLQHGRIVAIEIVADPASIARLDLTILDG